MHQNVRKHFHRKYSHGPAHFAVGCVIENDVVSTILQQWEPPTCFLPLHNSPAAPKTIFHHFLWLKKNWWFCKVQTTFKPEPCSSACSIWIHGLGRYLEEPDRTELRHPYTNTSVWKSSSSNQKNTETEPDWTAVWFCGCLKFLKEPVAAAQIEHLLKTDKSQS